MSKLLACWFPSYLPFANKFHSYHLKNYNSLAGAFISFFVECRRVTLYSSFPYISIMSMPKLL